jgi:hypothetical protein
MAWLAAAFTVALAQPALAGAGEVLILDPAGFDGGFGTGKLAAWFTAAGKTPVIVSPAVWSTLTTADFSSYDALAIPDPTCFGPGDSAIAAAVASAATWGAAVDGNVIVIGTDEVYHYTQGGDALMDAATDFVVAEAGKTGAYVSLSCYYHGTAPGTPLPWLGQAFGGTWSAAGVGCYNNAHIVATHPALAGLSDATLSNWSCSVHEGIDSWPIDFEVLAIARDIGSAFTAPDGSVGTPYIVARGVTVISDILLSPDAAVNPVGTSHALSALVTTDSPVPDTPVVGATVTFEVIAGPHAGTNGTGVTDTLGLATFAYTGTTVGTDTIEATFVDGAGRTQRSNRVTKDWITVSCVTLDFDTEDDLATPLANGQKIDDEFGALVTITGSGVNWGPAIFDSTVGGPNDPSQDIDLLVDTGNILVLQTENQPDVGGIFPRPNDDSNGGTLTFGFAAPGLVSSLRLVDADLDGSSNRVVLTDSNGKRRTYVVPSNWTGDRTLGQPGEGTLDLTSMAPQPGFASSATASEDGGFEPSLVVRLDVQLAGSGGVDDLSFCPSAGIVAGRADVAARNGSNVNPTNLRSWTPPLVGGTWVAGLDCGTHASGLAFLGVYDAPRPGTPTPYGELLVGGRRLLQSTRAHLSATVYFSQPVPHDVALVGLEAHVQGLCTGAPGSQLSNALDVVLGY